MKTCRIIGAIAGISFSLFGAHAGAADINVFSTTAFKSILDELGHDL